MLPTLLELMFNLNFIIPEKQRVSTVLLIIVKIKSAKKLPVAIAKLFVYGIIKLKLNNKNQQTNKANKN